MKRAHFVVHSKDVCARQLVIMIFNGPAGSLPCCGIVGAGRRATVAALRPMEKVTMIKSFVRRFIRDERGAALAEYAAIFLVLATAGTVVLITVGQELAAAGTAIDAWLAANVTGQF